MRITIKTRSRTDFVDITDQVRQKVHSEGIREGICLLYVPHTTAAVTINESADPSVVRDMRMVLDKLIPWEDAYRHLEGNSAAHVKSTLVGASQLIPIAQGQLTLGTWQGIFFCEFDGPRTRTIRVKIVAG